MKMGYIQTKQACPASSINKTSIPQLNQQVMQMQKVCTQQGIVHFCMNNVRQCLLKIPCQSMSLIMRRQESDEVDGLVASNRSSHGSFFIILEEPCSFLLQCQNCDGDVGVTLLQNLHVGCGTTTTSGTAGYSSGTSGGRECAGQTVQTAAMIRNLSSLSTMRQYASLAHAFKSTDGMAMRVSHWLGE